MVKIQDVISAGAGSAFLLSQGSKTFYAWGSRDYLQKYKQAGNIGPNEYIKPTLPGKKRQIALKTGKVDSHDLLCKQQIWTGMYPEELIFIKGRSERINKTTSAGFQQEQWVYKKPGGSEFQFDFFYFQNGLLKSWQN